MIQKSNSAHLEGTVQVHVLFHKIQTNVPKKVQPPKKSLKAQLWDLSGF